mmetsp:Transcript_6610/g.7223  ORF Transcript_6610/g.7223 Transcript_6610/m.7223 type:complete len:971 (+) Transcript_6610:41-2953(+)
MTSSYINLYFYFWFLLILQFYEMSESLSIMSTSRKLPNVRVELFFRNVDELRERVNFLSSEYGVKSFNLVNKSNQDTMLNWVDIIQKEVPYSSVCAHYSAKYNKSRIKDGAFLSFEDFRNCMKKMDGIDNNNEILIITGSGPKGRFNSVSALQNLAAAGSKKNDMFSSTKSATGAKTTTTTKIAVAYNPFFTLTEEATEERRRLNQKLATDQVKKIYFQFGTDLEKLRKSLDWLCELRDNNNDNSKTTTHNFTICGSIFLPTKKLIAQQKFRPWNGVFLNEEFLESEESARGIVIEMMRLYESYGCEILIEAPGIRNEKDMAIVESLLKERDSSRNPTVRKRMNEDDSTNNKIRQEKRSDHTITISGDKGRLTKRRKITGLEQSTLVSDKTLQKPAIFLFGSHDVRLHDNQAFQLASFHSNGVIPTFLWCRKEYRGKWDVRGALEVVLKDALRELEKKLLLNSNLKLICRQTDDVISELCNLCLDTGAITVYWNKEHTTESRARERKTKEALECIGIQVIECQSSLLYDPTKLSLASGFNGGHWGTLMPFLKMCKKQMGEPRRPIKRYETFALLREVDGPCTWPSSITVNDLDMCIVKGKNKWDKPILERFPMNEESALQLMNDFFRSGGGFDRYERDRSRADIECSTSKLSVALRMGIISPNEFYYKIEDSGLPFEDRKTISRRLYWRDLAYFQLSRFPNMRDRSIRPHYDETEWISGDEEIRRFHAWKTGNTGYPLVDAGMRELYRTGWMTQSIRMVVASFLTEYLRVNWVRGCEWFHYTLADADSAINAMMWQNAGRSGIDQWNFVMSPVAASQDGDGSYTKQWVPELSKLSKPLLHKPWEGSHDVLIQAGVVLGQTYPHRVVTNLKEERKKSVENVLDMRRENQDYNDGGGYDNIILPNGKRTVVFTKRNIESTVLEMLLNKINALIHPLIGAETTNLEEADKAVTLKTKTVQAVMAAQLISNSSL